MADVFIGGKSYSVNRVKLRKWLELESIREKIIKAGESRDRTELISLLYLYLSSAFNISEEKLAKYVWYEVAQAYIIFAKTNAPQRDYAFLKGREVGKGAKEVWDYEDRTFYIWVHILAEAYGWTIEYISDLDIDDGLALLQENLIEDQIEREWQWALSEAAYSYDKGSSTMKLKELPRPEWMVQKPVITAQPMKIKKSMLPAGVIKTEDGEEKNYHNE